MVGEIRNRKETAVAVIEQNGRVRIVDVAKAAGVAPSTVSKALNGTGVLRDDTRRRIREIADRLGFVPDASARGLHTGRTYTVGLLSTDSAGRFTLPIVLGAENALVGGEISALVATARHDPVRERHHLRALVARRVDGIIVTGRTSNPRAPISVPVPVVYAFAPSTDPTDVSVLPDEADGARQIVEHLHALGHRRLAHLTGRAENHGTQLRHRAVLEHAERLGMTVDPDPRYGEWSERWGRQAVDLILAEHTTGAPLPVDALVCGSDQLARGACDRLRERGIRVPADIAVTGYDNWDVMALASRPPLTTVDMRLETLGQRAAELLLALIDGGPAEPGLRHLEPRLIVRGSTLPD